MNCKIEEKFYINPQMAIKILKQKHCLENVYFSSSSELHAGSAEITTDSRAVKKGHIFIAYKGVKVNSHQFIGAALKRQPSLVILEDKEEIKSTISTTFVLVKNSRKAWTHLISEAAGNPQNKLILHGITGTNGKTSTVWMLRSLLERAQVPCLSIGTLGVHSQNFHINSPHTTPDPPFLFGVLKLCLELNIKHVLMEVSSHSIVQQKVAALKFDTLSWTSFSRDHLDFHKNMKEYWDAKYFLFINNLKSDGKAIFSLNVAPLPQKAAGATVLYYGSQKSLENKHIKNSSLAKISESKCHAQGTELSFSFKKEEYCGFIPFWGSYNAENFLNALLITNSITGEISPSRHWGQVPAVPGRFEPAIPKKKENLPLVIIDFSHTPDALEKALLTNISHSGKIFLVFGCGGDRDKGKRPEMAKVAEKLADHITITSDNPRTESEDAIIQDILGGFSMGTKVTVEKDRTLAINHAIKSASKEDLVLITGKGNEKYQIVGSKKIPFDDKKIAKKQLLALENRISHD